MTGSDRGGHNDRSPRVAQFSLKPLLVNIRKVNNIVGLQQADCGTTHGPIRMAAYSNTGRIQSVHLPSLLFSYLRHSFLSPTA